ncbi:MAG: VWA domain-containing protein [Saprospiraceae bacterium]|nr:VWA domain-containing protein [Saprospiraceae bacterium]
MRIFNFFLLFNVLLISFSAYGQPEQESYQMEQPYFRGTNEDKTSENLPLKGTEVRAIITGMIADVTILQKYQNKSNKPIEATYVFPLSDKAAVYSMEMRVGSRHISARIKERKQARLEYEEAKAVGQRATLLEEERPNVFTMNVANIMPGDTIAVEVKYTEYLIPDEGIYSFVFPTTVGPRYNNKGNNAKFASTPYLRIGEFNGANFELTAEVYSAVPINHVSSNSHKIVSNQIKANQFSVSLNNNEIQKANKDFVLNYSLRGSAIASGIQLYNHGNEQFFMAMIQPPKRIQLNDIPPREYVFVVDVSGSMHGFPLEVSKSLLTNLITNLRSTDYFNVILFSGSSESMAPVSIKATKENVRKAIAFIDNQYGGGGTEVLGALKQSLDLPRPVLSISRSVVIITDGYVTVEKEAMSLIRSKLDKMNVFAFGIGSGVNRYLINGLAHAGGGQPFIVLNESEADSIANKFRKYIQTPVLSNIQVKYKGFEAYDVLQEKVPDVMGERPVCISGKYRGKPGGKIVITGNTGYGRFEKEIFIDSTMESSQHNALRYLWAREKIMLADDYNEEYSDENQIKEITQLGLDYNLLTPFTSFVAIDKLEIVNADGKVELIEQASLLPEGVSELAIGADFNLVGSFVANTKDPYAGVLVGLSLFILSFFIFVLFLKASHADKSNNKLDHKP